MKLSSIVNISSGPNSREINERFNNLSTYNNNDLDKDLYQGYRRDTNFSNKGPIVNAGDLLLNTMTYHAGVVSKNTEGKIMPQNLIRLNGDYKTVDTWYLCYILNESIAIKHQLYRSLEGSIMRRVTTSSIKQLDIELPSITEQYKIGEIYRRMLIQIRINNEYSMHLKKAVLATLNKDDINGGNNNAN